MTTLLSFLIIYHFIVSTSSHIQSCINANHCSNTTINCPSNEDCLVRCHGINSCKNSIINCPITGKCEIECNNTASCKQTTINAPTPNEIYVNCDASESCFSTTFNTTKASLLNIEGCQYFQSCLDVSIYCPKNGPNDINCLIEGNDNLGSSSNHQSDGIKIYAVNGWNDIEINYNGTYSTNSHFGKMYCNENYNSECDFALNDWSCYNTEHTCNNPITDTTTTSISTIASSTSTPTTTKLSELDNPNSNDNSNVITLEIDISKLLLPITLSFVLLCCLIAACCIWYKILFKKDEDKKETNNVKMEDIIVENNNNINNTETDIVNRSSIVPSKSSANISQISAQPINIQNELDVNKRYRVSISSLAPPINVQHRNKSISHSGSQNSHLSHYNQTQVNQSIGHMNVNLQQSKFRHSNVNMVHTGMNINMVHMNMNMDAEGGLSEFENEHSDSELYNHVENNNNRTPIGTPQGTPEPPMQQQPEMNNNFESNGLEHKTIEMDDISHINMSFNHVQNNNNNDSDSDLYLQPNQSMMSKSNVTINGISTLGGTPPPHNINKHGGHIEMDIATDITVI